MEVRVSRLAYYFSGPDEEILDAKLLDLHGDDETWLYRMERGSFNNGHYPSPNRSEYFQSLSGSVDSRTFTRRKHILRPSLESVYNRSSLGILSASRLNDTKLEDMSTTPVPTNQGRSSSNFTDSDKPSVPRVFKLDSPFMNSPFQRKRLDSELSDSSFIPSLESQFDKNEAMTDSMINFLKRSNEMSQPHVSVQDEKVMSESLVSIPEKESSIGFSEEVMTNSMLSFLDPVTCKPPSGFEDEEINTTITHMDGKDVQPSSDLANSLEEYLECETESERQGSNHNEDENIPPGRLNLKKDDTVHRIRLIDTKCKLNSTFDINEAGDNTFKIEEDSDQSSEVKFTNNVNITRTNKNDAKEDFRKSLRTTFDKGNDEIHKLRALNNKDLNVTHDLNDEEFNLSKFKISSKSSLADRLLNDTFSRLTNGNSALLNGTFTKSANSPELNGISSGKNLNNTSNLQRQIPQRNSTFNTTFTKLDSELSRNAVSRSTEYLDPGADDDRMSSASDSSFSSAASSTKPRSVDELRSIAQQQESSLAHSSTPTESVQKTNFFDQLDLEVSPIKRVAVDGVTGRRGVTSRSAHCSPVRSPLALARPHPISRLQQPVMEERRQNLQASSLSNLTLTKPRPASGLRMPSRLARPDTRPATTPAAPATTPAAPATAIPRPQASRLPMPRFRTSGIPTMMKRGPH